MISTTNRFSTLSEENIEEEAKQSTEPKPPPFFIPGVKNIKPLTELLNEIAKDNFFLSHGASAQRGPWPPHSLVF
jgi:hypothetical protein